MSEVTLIGIDLAKRVFHDEPRADALLAIPGWGRALAASPDGTPERPRQKALWHSRRRAA